MVESELHPLGAIAWAQARGQKLELVQAVPVDNTTESEDKKKEKNEKVYHCTSTVIQGEDDKQKKAD